MTPWLPWPLVSLLLCALWLLLNQALDPANLLFGALLGVAVPLLTRRLQPLGYPRLRKPLVFLRLIGMASVEVVRSCLNVCRIILFRDYGTVRAEFMRIRQLEFVRAESAIGARHGRIIWKVILPNALPPLVVSATLAVGAAILFEAGLSFLGLGDPNQMSWGLMIGSARQYLLSCWWAVAFPGAAIFVTVLAVSLIGDGLNDALNPKLRER